MSRKYFLGLAAVLAAVAVVVAVSGGFRTTVGGLRISARSPLPILLLAFINLTLWWSGAKRAHALGADLESVWYGIERHASRLIGVVALVATIVAAAFATKSAAGADASGYVSQAAEWTELQLPLHVERLALEFRELDGWITTPLGWRPAADQSCLDCEAAQVPTYPPGLPLLMVIPHALAGVNGAHMIVVASAALTVWATGMLAGGVAGILAALLIAFSPVFINQSIQPMSDVPVTAAWMVCFLLAPRHSFASGLACACAVLIRPNLAPLALVPFFLSQNRFKFSLPVVVAGLLLAVLQWFWYGSPFQSGYGSTDELFSLANIADNVPRYVEWLVATSPLLLLAMFGFWRLRRDRTAQALMSFAAMVIAAYLIYAVFDEWSYLRFLLPALAIFAVFTAIELSAWIGRWPLAYRAPMLFALTLLVIAHGNWMARSLDTFTLADRLRRVGVVADYIIANVPPSAVLLSGEQSGSMRYYTDHPILRWEAATPDALAAAVTTLEESKRPVYIVLDTWEHPLFRAKFKALAAGALDWPPLLDAGTSHRTQLWKLGDRDRFVRGENVTTIRLP